MKTALIVILLYIVFSVLAAVLVGKFVKFGLGDSDDAH